MSPRLFIERPLDAPAWASGTELDLPPVAARHVQVLRLQPGSELTVFDGHGGQWQAQVSAMTRSGVRAVLQTHEAVERELGLRVTLAVGMPANDRMDDLVEKATELGVFGIAPLMSERSVLRLGGDRAAKRVAHWQAVAVAACEQSGRNRVPRVHAVQTLGALMAGHGATGGDTGLAGVSTRWALSLASSALALQDAWTQCSRGVETGASTHILLLSGPEGGLSPAEQEQAAHAGYRPVSLGPRTLRADTAPLAALAALGALHPASRAAP